MENDWKDTNNEVMPVKCLEERRVFQAYVTWSFTAKQWQDGLVGRGWVMGQNRFGLKQVILMWPERTKSGS